MGTAAVLFVDGIKISGKMSVMAAVNREKNPPVLSVTGLVETPVRLPDRFGKLEGGRVAVYDVIINSENVGSEDDNIVYEFSAKSYNIFDIKDKKKG